MKTYYNNKNSLYKDYKLDTLDLNFPVEYYDLNGCKNIICVFTSGIGRIPQGNYNKISLLNLFTFKNKKEKINWKLFMKNIGDDVLYPSSFEELKLILKQ